MTKLSPNWPVDPRIMNAGATDLRRKLRQFSDGCYQRATEATDADAMWLFTKAAQEARQRASNRHLSPKALIDALRALELQRNLAAWYMGRVWPTAMIMDPAGYARQRQATGHPLPANLLSRLMLDSLPGFTACLRTARGK